MVSAKGMPRSRRIAIAGICVAVAMAIWISALVRYFPYSHAHVVQSLQEDFPGRLQIARFHRTLFPHPGCIVEGLTFARSSSPADAPPLVTIQRLTIQGSYLELILRPHHISRVVMEGLHIQIPAIGSGSGESSGGYTQTQTIIGELIADGALLDIARKNGSSLRFGIQQLTLDSVGAKERMSYRLLMHNPEPPGEIRSTGHFGPWHTDDPGQTPVSGAYSLQRADLGVFHGIAGNLSSEDKFEGVLNHIEVHGSTDTPDFELARSRHDVHLASAFRAIVDGTNGDVYLQNVNASFLKTGVTAVGSITGKAGEPKKFTSLDLVVRKGRIQDVLWLFVRGSHAPMAGATDFRAHVTIPPEGRPFLKEITLEGDFGIGGGLFENPSTQQSVNKLSQTARGEKEKNEPGMANDAPELSNLRGHVVLRDGVATFTDLNFSVSGADAKMHGTYDLLSEKLDFHGTLKMEAKFSQTSNGIGSVFKKILSPFFDKKHGSIIPVKIDGTYEDPHFGIDLK
jgi:hypothetical protein